MKHIVMSMLLVILFGTVQGGMPMTFASNHILENANAHTEEQMTPQTPQEVTARLERKKTEFLKAKIITLEEEVQTIFPQDPDYNASLPADQKRRVQNIKLEMLAGHDRGKIIQTVNVIANQPKDLILAKDDFVIVNYTRDEETGKRDVYVIDHARANWSWVFIGAFLLSLFWFGGKKGFTSALGLVITVSLLLFVFIPGIMAGWNPLLLAIAISTIVTIMIHVFVAGFTAKAFASTIGTVGGTILASVLAAFAMNMTHLFGLSSEEARVLFLDKPMLDFRGIFLASIVVGSMGAVMDVGISISSAIKEVKEHHPNPTFHDLYTSGMNVGRDILGTMTDTLVLAYIGSALPSLLLMVSYNNWDMALNYDFIGEEIIRSIAGSFGLLAAIPLTAYFSALFESKKS